MKKHQAFALRWMKRQVKDCIFSNFLNMEKLVKTPKEVLRCRIPFNFYIKKNFGKKFWVHWKTEKNTVNAELTTSDRDESGFGEGRKASSSVDSDQPPPPPVQVAIAIAIEHVLI